jgi:hypothetical protein
MEGDRGRERKGEASMLLSLREMEGEDLAGVGWGFDSATGRRRNGDAVSEV